MIDSGELDNLGVTAFLNFVNPFSGQAQSVAVAGAVSGPLHDSGVDYAITFAPVTMAFGNGGSFTVDFQSLSFAQNSVTLPQTVTITLTDEPADTRASDATVAGARHARAARSWDCGNRIHAAAQEQLTSASASHHDRPANRRGFVF
jgi:hypothetical protein